MAVARAWAGRRGAGVASDPLTQAAMAAIGDRRPAPGEIELAGDEVDSAMLFLNLDTQWRVHPMTGRRIGLDYQAIAPVAQLLGIEAGARQLNDLRLMEGAALEAMSR